MPTSKKQVFLRGDDLSDWIDKGLPLPHPAYHMGLVIQSASQNAERRDVLTHRGARGTHRETVPQKVTTNFL